MKIHFGVSGSFLRDQNEEAEALFDPGSAGRRRRRTGKGRWKSAALNSQY